MTGRGSFDILQPGDAGRGSCLMTLEEKVLAHRLFDDLITVDGSRMVL
jgi:hypothetical protein